MRQAVLAARHLVRRPAAASHVAGVIAMLAPGAALDPAKAAATTPDGRSAVDDGIGAAFEGAVSFVEPVMQALPLGGENLDVAVAQAAGARACRDDAHAGARRI